MRGNNLLVKFLKNENNVLVQKTKQGLFFLLAWQMTVQAIKTLFLSFNLMKSDVFVDFSGDWGSYKHYNSIHINSCCSKQVHRGEGHSAFSFIQTAIC